MFHKKHEQNICYSEKQIVSNRLISCLQFVFAMPFYVSKVSKYDS